MTVTMLTQMPRTAGSAGGSAVSKGSGSPFSSASCGTGAAKPELIKTERYRIIDIESRRKTYADEVLGSTVPSGHQESHEATRGAAATMSRSTTARFATLAATTTAPLPVDRAIPGSQDGGFLADPEEMEGF